MTRKAVSLEIAAVTSPPALTMMTMIATQIMEVRFWRAKLARKIKNRKKNKKTSNHQKIEKSSQKKKQKSQKRVNLIVKMKR